MNNTNKTQIHEANVTCRTPAIALSYTERTAVPLSLWFQGCKYLVLGACTVGGRGPRNRC